jgi:hypothetical protein
MLGPAPQQVVTIVLACVIVGLIVLTFAIVCGVPSIRRRVLYGRKKPTSEPLAEIEQTTDHVEMEESQSND